MAMWLIGQIAVQRIEDAINNGVFDNLPGEGRLLNLDDDSLVPEELLNYLFMQLSLKNPNNPLVLEEFYVNNLLSK